ncbi:MAG: (Fe-S)-binding protein [Chitinophagia bacterium]|jgi:L-lactate dehydrogenase complex protein LldE|nr:(Fe-S)-binding protein [Chitinophagia bacterium]
MDVHVFIPCFIDQLYPDAGFNTIKVLEKVGCKVHYNPKQTCCGQPAFNAGYWGEAKEVCNKFIDDFQHAETIVIPSASCAGFVKNYYSKIYDNAPNQKDIKQFQGKVFELSDFLINQLKIEDVGASFHGKVAYHDSCAALRECNLRIEPKLLLSKVRGLELLEIKENETCCGFGGTFSVKFEGISTAMGEQKVKNIVDTNADYLVSTDLSCLMHLNGIIQKKGHTIKSMHLADILASGY